jgi:hypothetical protein
MFGNLEHRLNKILMKMKQENIYLGVDHAIIYLI